LDLYVEFRNHTNGVRLLYDNGLLGAMTHFGLDSMDASEKEEMRALALRGDRYTEEEKVALVDYCQADVDSTVRLLKAMLPTIRSFPHAVYRGRYMKAVARMEYVGVPVNLDLWRRLCESWPKIAQDLIAKIDVEYNVYEGTTFKERKFEEYLVRAGIPWPRLPSGKLDKRGETFDRMVDLYPQLSNLEYLRNALSQMSKAKMQIGADGWNRALLSPFKSTTGRNQPSNAKFIFGAPSWMRHIIQPKPGEAIAYIDWSQQEFGIAAALSGDQKMMEAYSTGDVYLAFAKQAGAVPPDATKQSHPKDRELFKACVLATQYGMGIESLAAKINQPGIVAKRLLDLHREVYPRFWAWAGNQVDMTTRDGYQRTVYRWYNQIDSRSAAGANPRSLQNFFMQANGAEMLRVACILATEAGIRIAAPVHDAVMIVAAENDIDQDVERMRGYMAEASRLVLEGFELRTDVSITRHPNFYDCEKGRDFWQTVSELLAEVK
jgi:DNA polymerase I-like protein with 3'-5' exonuclease and polymerase domains